MTTVDFSVSAELVGSPERAYDILADYHQGHPSILPAEHFPYLEVEEGGRGAGTVIRFGVKMAGRVQDAVADVSEPEPGRVLVERVRDARGTVTTFTTEAAGAERVRVTIRSTWTARGLLAPLERWMAPRLLRPIYRQELENLERAMARKSPPSALSMPG